MSHNRSDAGKSNKIVTKADLILIVLLMILGIVPLFFIFTNDNVGNKINIDVNKTRYGTYSLKKNQTIRIKQPNGHVNIVEIKNGKARMKYSTCTNQNCVHQGDIESENQNIVCLPNKVIVTVDSSDDSNFDSVSK